MGTPSSRTPYVVVAAASATTPSQPHARHTPSTVSAPARPPHLDRDGGGFSGGTVAPMAHSMGVGYYASTPSFGVASTPAAPLVAPQAAPRTLPHTPMAATAVVQAAAPSHHVVPTAGDIEEEDIDSLLGVLEAFEHTSRAAAVAAATAARVARCTRAAPPPPPQPATPSTPVPAAAAAAAHAASLVDASALGAIADSYDVLTASADIMAQAEEEAAATAAMAAARWHAFGRSPASSPGGSITDGGDGGSTMAGYVTALPPWRPCGSSTSTKLRPRTAAAAAVPPPPLPGTPPPPATVAAPVVATSKSKVAGGGGRGARAAATGRVGGATAAARRTR